MPTITEAPQVTSVVTIGRVRRRRMSASLSERSERRLSLFSIPAMAWYAIFTLGPLIAMFVISLLVWGGFLDTPEWAGVANFQKMFTDPAFSASAVNTAIQLAIDIPVMMPLAFMLGYYLSLNPRFHRVLRVILFMPALISLAALGSTFYAIFQPTGLLNSILGSMGLGQLTTAWLANPDTALGTIIAVDIWSGVGFTAVLFAARLTSVSSETYEAAELDGCGHWGKMWRIAFPSIKDYFGVLTMLQFLWILFSSAGLVLLLTRGGPGTASSTLSYLVYEKAFVEYQIGYSQAVGVVLFIVGIIGLVGIRRLFRQDY